MYFYRCIVFLNMFLTLFLMCEHILHMIDLTDLQGCRDAISFSARENLTQESEGARGDTYGG